MSDNEIRELRCLLYEAIKELDYVQVCGHSDDPDAHELCASARGEEIIQEGMALLGVKDLAVETLP